MLYEVAGGIHRSTTCVERYCAAIIIRSIVEADCIHKGDAIRQRYRVERFADYYWWYKVFYFYFNFAFCFVAAIVDRRVDERVGERIWIYRWYIELILALCIHRVYDYDRSIL